MYHPFNAECLLFILFGPGVLRYSGVLSRIHVFGRMIARAMSYQSIVIDRIVKLRFPTAIREMESTCLSAWPWQSWWFGASLRKADTAQRCRHFAVAYFSDRISHCQPLAIQLFCCCCVLRAEHKDRHNTLIRQLSPGSSSKVKVLDNLDMD